DPLMLDLVYHPGSYHQVETPSLGAALLLAPVRRAQFIDGPLWVAVPGVSRSHPRLEFGHLLIPSPDFQQITFAIREHAVEPSATVGDLVQVGNIENCELGVLVDRQ